MLLLSCNFGCVQMFWVCSYVVTIMEWTCMHVTVEFVSLWMCSAFCCCATMLQYFVDALLSRVDYTAMQIVLCNIFSITEFAFD